MRAVATTAAIANAQNENRMISNRIMAEMHKRTFGNLSIEPAEPSCNAVLLPDMKKNEEERRKPIREIIYQLKEQNNGQKREPTKYMMNKKESR